MIFLLFFFFFKQKTAYEMRISDWSSDVCSSDLSDADWRPALLSEIGPRVTSAQLGRPIPGTPWHGTVRFQRGPQATAGGPARLSRKFKPHGRRALRRP